MILIAESGSTKTQWCLVNSEKTEYLVNTPGINPIILSKNEIESIIRPVSASFDLNKLDAVYFFGAGCSIPKSIQKIETTFTIIFKCKNIKVDTDLKAACYALAGEKPGIIGLLGTGSNSCLWDGQKIEQKIPSLGYILGDEGGGVSIGKQLITDYLKHQMPELIRRAFFEKYNITTDYVLERVYQSPMPNRFLAGFAPFIEENIENDYCRMIIYIQFEKYLRRNILLYNNPNQYDLYFCGSIAFYHKDILEELCKKYELNLKLVIKEPISELIKYLKKINHQLY